MAYSAFLRECHLSASFAKLVAEKNRVIPEAVGASRLINDVALHYSLARADLVASLGIEDCNDRAELRMW